MSIDFIFSLSEIIITTDGHILKHTWWFYFLFAFSELYERYVTELLSIQILITNFHVICSDIKFYVE